MPSPAPLDPTAKAAMSAPYGARVEPAGEPLGGIEAAPSSEMSPFVCAAASSFTPAFDCTETADGFVVTGDLPGVRRADVYVTVTGHHLRVRGHREAEPETEGGRALARERPAGDFARTFTLPEEVDLSEILADLTAGVLRVTIHKKPRARMPGTTLRSGPGGS